MEGTKDFATLISSLLNGASSRKNEGMSRKSVAWRSPILTDRALRLPSEKGVKEKTF